MTKSLFQDKRDPESFTWRAYMSSALTISEASTRDRVIHLNSLVKSWLEELADTFVYLPQDYSDPSRGDKMKPEEIYILDRWRIAESDFLIMNLDVASFGVGQEAEIACSMGIPIIAFHYIGVSVSRIIKGLPALFTGEDNSEPSEGLIRYQDHQHYEDLKGALLAKVKKVQKLVKPLPSKISSLLPFSKRLKSAIDKSGKQISQVAKEAGFTEAFLKSIINEYRTIEAILEPYSILKLCKLRQIPEDRYLNPGLWVLRRLSETLSIRLSTLIGEEDLDRIWHEPLKLASKNGVTLEEFVEVSDKADYLVIYQKAARSIEGNDSSQEVADKIKKLVEVDRNEHSKKKS